jgi:hypothetical protein
MGRGQAYAFALACIVAVPAAAQTLPSPFDLQAGLAGRWTGALGYRDYKTNKLFELAVTTDIQVLPDKATVIRISAFDDGPKTGLVYITSASLYDPAKSSVSAVSFRKGQPAEVSTDTVRTVTYTDPTHWVVQYSADGSDDNKPALLRTTETRDGDNVLMVKEVMPKAATAKGWQFRNQTRLSKVAG